MSAEHKKSPAVMMKKIDIKPNDIPLPPLIANDINRLKMDGRFIRGDFIKHCSYRVPGDAFAWGRKLN